MSESFAVSCDRQVAAFGQEGRRRNLTPKLPGADDLGCGLCNVRAANEASGGVGASSSAM